MSNPNEREESDARTAALQSHATSIGKQLGLDGVIIVGMASKGMFSVVHSSNSETNSSYTKEVASDIVIMVLNNALLEIKETSIEVRQQAIDSANAVLDSVRRNLNFCQVATECIDATLNRLKTGSD